MVARDQSGAFFTALWATENYLIHLFKHIEKNA